MSASNRKLVPESLQLAVLQVQETRQAGLGLESRGVLFFCAHDPSRAVLGTTLRVHGATTRNLIPLLLVARCARLGIGLVQLDFLP